MGFLGTLSTDADDKVNPAWSDVEHAIQSLDGRTVTLVTLAPPSPKGVPEGDHHMAVGGDGARFIVYITVDNLRFWNLFEPAKQSHRGTVRMLIGGQEGQYQEAQCVSRQMALRAARQYFEDGGRASDLSWNGG